MSVCQVTLRYDERYWMCVSVYYQICFPEMPHPLPALIILRNIYISFVNEKKKKNKNDYRKIPKISDTRKFAVITFKVEQDGVPLE